MKIAVSADSTCDIPQEYKDRENVFIMPIAIILGEEETVEGKVDYKDLYAYVDKTGVLPKTAARSSYDYLEHFKAIKKDFDAVIHISLSSEISSSYQNALSASKEIDNVFVVDSRSLSSGSGLLVLSALDKIAEEKLITQILSELNEEVGRVQASFIISKLNYLHKGGRCSSIAMFGANLLKLKIRIQLKLGKMQATKKYMGKLGDVLIKYVDEMVKENEPDLKRVFVTSSSPMEEKPRVVERCKELGFEEVIEMQAGATICSHCGPGTLGILYISKLPIA